MDRRTFLKSSTAAAAIPAGAAVAATFTPTAQSEELIAHQGETSPARHHWRFARPNEPLLHDHAERLMAQIITASDGAITADWREASADTALIGQQLRAGEIDAAFGIAPDLLADAGLSLFTGLPGAFSLSPEQLLAWHAVHGANRHLDDIAVAHDVKILLAGHTGPHPGLWADHNITNLDDFATACVTASGLGQIVCDNIRARHADAGLKTSSRTYEFPADPACALRDARAMDLGHFFSDGLHQGGQAVTLILSASAWRRLTPSSQALIKTTACAALQEAISVAVHHHQVVIPALIKAGTIAPRPLPNVLREAIDHGAVDVVGDYIARDPRFAPAWSAYQAFQQQMTGRTFPASVSGTA